MLRNFFSLSVVVVVVVRPFSVIVGFYCGRQDFVGKKYEWKKVAEHSSNDFIHSYSSFIRSVFLPLSLLSLFHSVMILLPPVCVFRF